MGAKKEEDMGFHCELNLNFKQVLSMLGQLTDEQKVAVLNLLKKELEKKGLLTWVKNEEGNLLELHQLPKSKKYKKPEISIEMMRDWEADLPEEDEKEMTDEEFFKAVEEMS